MATAKETAANPHGKLKTAAASVWSGLLLAEDRENADLSQLMPVELKVEKAAEAGAGEATGERRRNRRRKQLARLNRQTKRTCRNQRGRTGGTSDSGSEGQPVGRFRRNQLSICQMVLHNQRLECGLEIMVLVHGMDIQCHKEAC